MDIIAIRGKASSNVYESPVIRSVTLATRGYLCLQTSQIESMGANQTEIVIGPDQGGIFVF